MLSLLGFGSNNNTNTASNNNTAQNSDSKNQETENRNVISLSSSKIILKAEDIFRDVCMHAVQVIEKSGGALSFVSNNMILFTDKDDCPAKKDICRRAVQKENEMLYQADQLNTALQKMAPLKITEYRQNINEKTYLYHFFTELVTGVSQREACLANLPKGKIIKDRYGIEYRLNTIREELTRRAAIFKMSIEEFKKNLSKKINRTNEPKEISDYFEKLKNTTHKIVRFKEIASAMNVATYKTQDQSMGSLTYFAQKDSLERLNLSLIQLAGENEAILKKLEKNKAIELHMQKQEIESRFKKIYSRIDEVTALLEERKRSLGITDTQATNVNIKHINKIHCNQVIFNFFKDVIEMKEDLLLESEWEDATLGIDKENSELYEEMIGQRLSTLTARIVKYEELMKVKATVDQTFEQTKASLSSEIEQYKFYEKYLTNSLKTIESNFNLIESNLKLREANPTVPPSQGSGLYGLFGNMFSSSNNNNNATSN